MIKQNLNLGTPLLQGDGNRLSYRESETPVSVFIEGLGCLGAKGVVYIHSPMLVNVIALPALPAVNRHLVPSPLNLSLYTPESLMSVFGVSERTEVATGSAPKVASCVKQKTQRLTDLTGDRYDGTI
jgi:hypothetical protein